LELNLKRLSSLLTLPFCEKQIKVFLDLHFEFEFAVFCPFELSSSPLSFSYFSFVPLQVDPSTFTCI
jgi:hypothetical protein